MLCPLCNNEIHDESKFCGKCGKKIPRCPTCGKVIRKRSRFCTNDGTPIPEEILALLPNPITPAPAEPKPTAPSKPSAQAPARPRASHPKPAPVKKKKSPMFTVLIVLLVVLALVLIGLLGYIAWDAFADAPDSDDNSSSASSRRDDDDEKDPDDEEEPAKETDPAPIEATQPPTEAPTEPPVITYEYRYEVIASDMSWDEAKAVCEAKGGYLATITSAEEHALISELASKSGLTYLWIGACLPAGTSDWSSVSWVTGEEWGYQNWYPGEPSIIDNDGAMENALCLWNAKYEGTNIGWTFNDQRSDLVGALPTLSGRVGYICEYRIEVTE